MWSFDTWEKRKLVTIQIPAGKAPVGDTRVQFHTDQIRLLVVHESQLAIYDASKMDRIRQVGSLLKFLQMISGDKLGTHLILFILLCSGSHKTCCLHPFLMQRTPAIVN